MQQEDIDCWDHFSTRLAQLKATREEARSSHLGVSKFLFRGHENADWNLATTLERLTNSDWSFSKYFELISRAKPQIESFTDRHWEFENLPKLREWASNYDNLKMSPFPAYDYLVYLRHHGFPSPLLDWTRSPYVAAYFAFTQPSTDRVAIYVYWEDSGCGKSSSSNHPQLVSFGPYVKTHSRHFLQQSQYTISAKFKANEWGFASHEEVFASGQEHQDHLWKFTLPSSERKQVLKILDAHNLNTFSLFQNEEALLRTIATREVELRE